MINLFLLNSRITIMASFNLSLGKEDVLGGAPKSFVSCNLTYPPDHLKLGERTLVEIKNLLINASTI